jgi:hypothetical protein
MVHRLQIPFSKFVYDLTTMSHCQQRLFWAERLCLFVDGSGNKFPKASDVDAATECEAN